MAGYRHRMADDQFEPFKEYEFYFQSFLHFAVEINEFINKEIATEREQYDFYRKELEATGHWEEDQFFHNLDLKTKEGFADIYFDSLIVSMFSFVEKKMLVVCHWLEKNQLFKLNEIKGTGILKFRLYLEKCGVDFSEIPAEWEMLVRFKELRNILVHAEGNRLIPNNEKQLISFLKKTDGVVLSEGPDGATFHFRTNEIIFALHRCAKFVVNCLFYEKVEETI
jgi:hypothetical protein